MRRPTRSMRTLLQQQDMLHRQQTSDQDATRGSNNVNTQNSSEAIISEMEHWRALTRSTRFHVSLGQNGPPNHNVC
eukprot:6188909-Alexandrium_andersonii.AAC.1